MKDGDLELGGQHEVVAREPSNGIFAGELMLHETIPGV
jgi:hypothetical protein